MTKGFPFLRAEHTSRSVCLAGLISAVISTSVAAQQQIAQSAPVNIAPSASQKATPQKAKTEPQKADTASKPGGALGNLGGNSKDPIKIDADRLEVFDREKRAVFQGNVVAVQADTTIRCTTMTVFYEQGATSGAAKPATPPSAPTGGDSAVKKVDCTGPVTVVSKDQVASGDNAVFDRVANIVTLTGNAALSQGQNVTRGDKVIYNVNTGIANVEGGRVRALFVPGSESTPPGGTPAQPRKKPNAPAPQATN